MHIYHKLLLSDKQFRKNCNTTIEKVSENEYISDIKVIICFKPKHYLVLNFVRINFPINTQH